MPATIYVMEAANLFCGDHDPSQSKHLTLEELQLPALNEMYQDHHPGGSRVQVEIATGIEKLEPTFKLAGWDPDLLTQFGMHARQNNVFTAYGSIRDKRTGVAIEAKAVMQGRLGSIEAETFQRGEMMGHDYAVHEVMHYELWFGGEEKWYWDFWSNTLRLGGTSQTADENAILRVPSA